MRLKRGVAVFCLLTTLWSWQELAGQSNAGAQLAWYGFIKLDSSWDEGLMDTGNFARWVLSEDLHEPHGHFSMTARQTRLGFRLASALGDAAITGKWEADFYGGGAENKNHLHVRHAYLEVAWPSGWSVLAGQTSDVISPLNPATVNYTVGWWAGNIGYRHPQIRITRSLPLRNEGSLTFQAAAVRTVGTDFQASEPGDAGSESEVPGLQGLVGVNLPGEDRAVSFGFFAHRGWEDLTWQIEDGERIPTWGWGSYLRATLGAVSLAGEGWDGSNLDDFLGGVGQGIRTDGPGLTGIRSRGGWSEVTIQAGPCAYHLGAAMDDPEAEDLPSGGRDRNSVFWGNVMRDLGGGLTAGLEVSRWKTEYLGMADGTSYRVQGALSFTF